MENLLDTLSGIERIKYLKALIEKVNNIGSNTSNGHAQPPKQESQMCSACTSKTKRFMLHSGRNSAKIDLKRAKPISQKCDVHRLKFVRHPHKDSKSCTSNALSKCEVKTRPAAEPQTEIKSLEAARDASFEAEKNYLRKIYSTKPTSEVDDQRPPPKPVKHVEIKKKYEHPTQIDGAAFCRMHPATVDLPQNIRPAIEQGSSIINAILPQQSQPQLANSVLVERGRKPIGDGGVTNRNRTLAIANAQQSLSDPPITVNSDGTRQIASQPCAHCHQPISDVAFFNGNRQLCVECADSHFRRVTRASKIRKAAAEKQKKTGEEPKKSRIEGLTEERIIPRDRRKKMKQAATTQRQKEKK